MGIRYSSYSQNSNVPHKTLRFSRDKAGWNNVRITFESLVCVARITQRILVLPPPSYIEHVPDRQLHELEVYDPESLAALVQLRRGATQNPTPSFRGSLDEFLKMDRRGQLGSDVALCPRATRIQHFECLALGPADQRLAAETVARMRLADFYIEAAAAALSRAGLAPGSYHAVHLRRGDFAQFRPESQWSGKDLQGRVRNSLPDSEKTLPLLVACAVEKGEMDPFPELAAALRERKVVRTDEIRGSHLSELQKALVDTLLLVQARRFVGTPDSTFSTGVWHWRARDRVIRGEKPERCEALDVHTQPTRGSCWQRCTTFDALFL